MPGLSPTLLGMPHFILDNIIEKTDVFARCSLQKCSKHLQNFVPKSPFHFEEIRIFFAFQMMSLEMTANSETLIVKYCDPSFHETEEEVREANYIRELENLSKPLNPEKRRTVEVRDVNYIQRLVSDLVANGGGAKVTVGKLKFKVAKFFYPRRPDPYGCQDENGKYPMEQCTVDLTCFIDSLLEKLDNRILKVETLDFLKFPSKYEDDVLKILGTLKPGYLKNFYIGSTWGAIEKPFTRLTSTEHWKQASRLHISAHKVSVNELAHFKTIVSTAFEPSIQYVDDLVQAALTQGDNFDSYKAYHWSDNTSLQKYVEESIYYINRNRGPLRIGQFFISGGKEDLEIRRVSAEYLEEQRKDYELIMKWRAENNIN